MNKAWNIGHKPTNYTKWKTTTQPYFVSFKNLLFIGRFVQQGL